MSLKTVLPCAALLLAIAGARGAPAQANPDPDILGLYFDAAATTTALDATPGTVVPLYLILTNPAAAEGISGWECSVEVISSGTYFALSTTLARGMNMGSGQWDLFVPIGRPQALASRPVVLLATLSVFIVGSETYSFYLHPCSRPSQPGAMIYAADDDPGDFRVLGWSSGDEALPVAVINPPAPPATTVVMDPDPDMLNAPWSLAGPDDALNTGAGDSTLVDMPAGDYTVTWGPVPGWTVPADQTLTLGDGQTITFTGVYTEIPTVGTVVMDPEPDALDAPWSVVGPDKAVHSGAGDSTLVAVPTGDYTVTWGEVPNWTTPAPQTLALSDGAVITFTGTYFEIPPVGTVIMNPDPDALAAPWFLAGPEGFSAEGTGDRTFADVAAGTYFAAWGEVFGWRTPPPDTLTVARDETIVFSGLYTPAAAIAGITDVGNDQGRQVRIVFARCVFDAAGDTVPVTAYGLYRRQDQYKRATPTTAAPVPAGADKILGWDFLATVPAHGEDFYQCVAPTLCDSTAEGGICWSVFFVRTMTDDPLVFFDSAPDSGYSIDNLEPAVPKDFAVAFAAEGNLLTWTRSDELDLCYYRVYRSERASPEPGLGDLVQTVAGTAWTDELSGAGGDPWDYIYVLTAVDFAGNESEPTQWQDTEVTGADGSPLPHACRLYPCYPNPFNPVATIGFDLPDERKASLRIYDLSGRLVRSLVEGTVFGPGHHEVVWDGKDSSDREASAGVYCYRLQAGGDTMTMRMTLVR